MVKKFFVLILGFFFFLITSSYIHAASIDMAWDPPQDGGECLGYIVYGSTTSGDYSAPVAVEIVQETYTTVSGLDKSKDHYFIVKAYNCAGFSDASNELFIEAYSDAFYDDETYDTSSKSAGGCFIATSVYGSLFKSQDTSITWEIVIALMIMMLTTAIGGYLVRRFRVHGSQLKR